MGARAVHHWDHNSINRKRESARDCEFRSLRFHSSLAAKQLRVTTLFNFSTTERFIPARHLLEFFASRFFRDHDRRVI